MSDFDSREHLELAKKILENESTLSCNAESIYRTVINRCYYFSYLFALQYLESYVDYSHDTKNTKSSHASLWNYCEKRAELWSPDCWLDEVSDKGNRLLKKRKDADYRINIRISKNDALKSLKDAEDILTSIQNHIT